MKDLQIIEGVPRTHRCRSHRWRPKGLKTDHRRTLHCCRTTTFPVAHHYAVTIPLLSFGYYLYCHCRCFDHVRLRHAHHRLSLIRRCFELAVVLVAVVVGISSSSSSMLLLTHRRHDRVVATRAFASVYAVAAALSFVNGNTGFALDPQQRWRWLGVHVESMRVCVVLGYRQ